MNKGIRRKSFKVTLDVPEGVSIAEMRDYIETAVRTWCGGGCPDDPIFQLDGDSVKVTQLREVKK